MAKREIRVPVLLTQAERKVILDAAGRLGVGVSTYIRMKALEAAKKGDGDAD